MYLCIGWKRESYCPDHKFWYFVLITGLNKVFLLLFNCCLLSMASNSLPAHPMNTQKQCALTFAYRQLRRTTWHICYAWYQITESLMNVMSNKKKELGVLQIALDTYPKHWNTLLCSVKKKACTISIWMEQLYSLFIVLMGFCMFMWRDERWRKLEKRSRMPNRPPNYGLLAWL